MKYLFCYFVFAFLVKNILCDLVKCKTVLDPVMIANCSGLGLDDLPPSLNHVRDHAPIKKLIINNNNLNSSVSFKDWESLISLDLSSNKISNISDDTFGSLKSLKHLSLSYNNISFISTQAFSKLTALEILDLSGNPLLGSNFGIVKQSLAPVLYGSLKKLTISSSNISQIPSDMFNNTYELQYLDLSNNNISEIPELPKTLIYFRGSNNSIKNIGILSFRKSVLLKDIYLENNTLLTYIDVDAFEPLSNLRNVSFKGCKSLEHVPSHLFYFNKKLKFVSLANCNFKTLPHSYKSTFSPHNDLNVPLLELENNPWVCNVSVKWFTNLQPDNENLRCASPVNVTISDYYGTNMRIAVLRRLLVGLVFVVFILFGAALYISFNVEKKKRQELPYLRLQGKNPLGNRVYVTTVV